METINKIADYLISVFHENGDEVSKMKLQKLLFFAQGLYISRSREPLFDEDFEAWKYGPVSRTIHKRFAGLGWKDVGGEEIAKPEDLPEEVREHLDSIIEAFGGASGVELGHMTHKAEPWIKAWNKGKDDQYPCEIIRKDEIGSFFSSLEDKALGRLCEIAGKEEDDDEVLTLEDVRKLRASV